VEAAVEALRGRTAREVTLDSDTLVVGTVGKAKRRDSPEAEEIQ
jgi:hypothetical protein